ncbi:SDR family oxidoreductase [Clostridium perfringens]|nr:SDR family oxidoreductase [Clostridium perfringens]MDK0763686.1 SDR family oxidoreductase [Clostridium perfringens]MDM0818307.1 SDR family oxidoreductase [Clostridium perfringens]MDM0888792.1 SDR family oxidoreductase [Clostridium perfringens]MDM0900583.1 SDR family oxidoreductase [Clostridium perfringens]
MKKTVLITGATSGIGYEFSKIFMENHYNVILVGRNLEKLIELEDFSKKKYVRAYIYKVDFSLSEDIDILYEKIKTEVGRVDILINNAGIGLNGEFNEIDWQKQLDIINVNIISLTKLTKLILKDMLDQKEGRILNVASTGAYQPGPLISVYYASKAYVLSFSQALREEVKDKGINVVTLCPGATKTNFSKRAGKGDLDVAMSAKEVAEYGYKALMNNKAICIPGIMNKVLVFLSKVSPTTLNAKIVKKIQNKAISKK